MESPVAPPGLAAPLRYSSQQFPFRASCIIISSMTKWQTINNKIRISTALGITLMLSASPRAETIKGSHHEVTTRAPAAVTVASLAHVKVTISAGPGYKVNKEYPTKLQITAVPGVEFPKLLLKKTDGTFSNKSKTFALRVPFKVKKGGKFPFKGLLKFSVCDASRCLIEKQKLNAILVAQ